MESGELAKRLESVASRVIAPVAKEKGRPTPYKYNVGQRIEIAKLAISAGIEEAAKKYKLSAWTVQGYVDDFRGGKYTGVPLNYNRVRRIPLKSQRNDLNDEITALKTEIQTYKKITEQMMQLIEKISK